MTDQNQLLRDVLREAREALAHCIRLYHLEHERITLSKIESALAAQPAEGGEVDDNPLSKRCYTMSESHLSGYRLIVGFESLDDAQAAHSWVANIGRTTPPASQEQAQQPSGEVFEKLRSAASLAWEAMEKHRQFKGEAPCGMLGVRAMEELREAMRLAVTFPDAAAPKPEPMTWQPTLTAHFPLDQEPSA